MSLDSELVAEVRRTFDQQKAMSKVGATIAHLAAGECDLRLPYDITNSQQHGFVHGGIVAMIADTACGIAARTTMPLNMGILTAEFKLNLLAPAEGDYLIAQGRVVRAGRRLVVTQGDVFSFTGDKRKHIALITATMMTVEFQ
jgi:uncharacterized protein (TIGR00369 family)